MSASAWARRARAQGAVGHLVELAEQVAQHHQAAAGDDEQIQVDQVLGVGEDVLDDHHPALSTTATMPATTIVVRRSVRAMNASGMR